MTWQTDFTDAPKDNPIWLATTCKKVIQSYWIEPAKPGQAGRWAFIGTKETPRAWHEFFKPIHPDAGA